MRKSRPATGGVILAAAVVLTLAGGCWLVAWNAWNVMRLWRAEVKLVVYLNETATQDTVAAVRTAILSEPAVRNHRLISEAEAMTEFLQMMQSDRSLLEGLGDHLFPVSIEVWVEESAQTPTGMDALASKWRQLPGVESVRYGEALVRELSAAARVVWIVGTVIGAVLAAGVAVVVGVMANVALRAQRDEIALLKLLGATDGIVFKPFILRGAATGGLGGLVAAAALGGAWWAFRSRMTGVGDGILNAWLDRMVFPPEFVVALIGLGAMVGGVGSVIAARRVNRLTA